jgi:hypothetical protein
MNSTALVITLVVIGAVVSKLLLRRFPKVTKTQTFCGISACVASLSLVIRQSVGSFWYYTGLVVFVVIGTFLLMAWLRHLDTPRSTESA